MCRGVLNHLHVELVSVISARSISQAPSPLKGAGSKSLHGNRGPTHLDADHQGPSRQEEDPDSLPGRLDPVKLGAFRSDHGEPDVIHVDQCMIAAGKGGDAILKDTP